MKFDYLIDLFSGAGGFTLGLQQAGIRFDEIYYSDIDKYANAVYKYNYPKHKELGDVKSIRTESLPKGKGIVTFGFPCQDLSIAGKRRGLDGYRSGLFYEAIRIIRNLQPEIFIFENVKGLFSADEGQAFIRVLQEIADIGIYDCEWQLVNTRWVLPQNRERIFFIGHLKGRSEPKVFPIKEGYKQYNRKSIMKEIDYGFQKTVYNKSGISTSIRAEGGGQGAKTGLYQVYDDYNQKMRKDGNVGTITGNIGSKTKRNGQKIIKNRKIRRLTPTECERLQGFPDNWTAKGNFDEEIKEISDTQRYKMMGNAVTVTIVEMIGRRLYESKNDF